MIWTDTYDIAIALEEKHADVDILGLSFPTLREMILALPGFAGDLDKCNERILEAVQMAWLDERS